MQRNFVREAIVDLDFLAGAEGESFSVGKVENFSLARKRIRYEVFEKLDILGICQMRFAKASI